MLRSTSTASLVSRTTCEPEGGCMRLVCGLDLNRLGGIDSPASSSGCEVPAEVLPTFFARLVPLCAPEGTHRTVSFLIWLPSAFVDGPGCSWRMSTSFLGGPGYEKASHDRGRWIRRVDDRDVSAQGAG